MIAALEPLWWAQGITNVILCVAWLKLKRQVDSMQSSDPVARQWLGEHDSRIDTLEAAERARKDPTK